MRRVALILAVAVGAVVAAGAVPAGQTPRTPAFADAYEAWEMGRYDEALTQLQGLLPGADEATFERIALLTGELYETTELTTDGRNPAFAGTGGLVTYETGPAAAPRTHLVDTGGPRVVATVDGIGAVGDAAGRALAYIPSTGAGIVIREVATGRETTIETGAERAQWLAWTPDGSRLLYAVAGSPTATRIFSASLDGTSTAVPSGDGIKLRPRVSADGRTLIVQLAEPGSSAARPRLTGATIVNLTAGTFETIQGGDELALSPNGSIVPLEAARVAAPAFSPDGSKIAYQAMREFDWEIYVASADGTGAARVTREIQHDVLPQFLGNDRLLAVMGEPRHRRSYLYDLNTGAKQRLFHNNTIRTIAPEYAWTASADGTKVLIVADRDGDTISPARGVYLVDLSRRVSRAALAARIDAMLASERSLRAFAARVTAPLAPAIRDIVDRASISRVFGYEKALFDFDSKHITQPGNAKASAYLHDTYASFGYTPEYQWFEPRNALGGRTANVIATLRGTVHPEVIYVVSSHYDSVATGPGADDDTSGTAALLEAARIMAGRPQPATIVFASFTGEEAGLLGSREFVRRTSEAQWHVAGALNNDMIGWANDHRLDNTIRYSNPGIRDIQHAVALTFTGLITYDAHYYRGTDAAAFYEAWGDIVGGIGSYPVLGNPHYHQPHDVLETINHQLVTEVAKTTAATLVMLSNSPSRVRGLTAQRSASGVSLAWDAAPERDVREWVVTWQAAGGAPQRQVVTAPRATITGVPPGSEIQVVAINARGLESWDRARIVVP